MDCVSRDRRESDTNCYNYSTIYEQKEEEDRNSEEGAELQGNIDSVQLFDVSFPLLSLLIYWYCHMGLHGPLVQWKKGIGPTDTAARHLGLLIL